jgi:shikimate dehydrogenase
MGAGGAGSAVASALLSAGADSLTLFDVDHDRAVELATRMADRFPSQPITVLDAVPTALPSIDGLVNSTPVGMLALPGTPIDSAILNPDMWVADIVYFPLQTQLLKAADAIGCRTIDGSGMVISQAALAFEIITGNKADVERMRQSFVI